MRNMIDNSTECERAAMLKAGVEQVTVQEINRRLQALGYELEPNSRCSGIARNLTTDTSFKCVTWGVREQDTKRGAYHFQSRRDERFKAMQQLRQDVFAYVRGYIVTI